MASLSTCHLGLWLGWQILLNFVKYYAGKFILVKVYPVRENAHIQMYLLLPLLNLMDVNVITYVCLFVI